jgi:type III secretory pathway component EscS
MLDSVSVQVVRGSESWQFFAFVFAAVFGLSISLLGEVKYFSEKSLPSRLAIKLLLFMGCFYFFVLNHWTRNHLAEFLGWLKVENY